MRMRRKDVEDAIACLSEEVYMLYIHAEDLQYQMPIEQTSMLTWIDRRLRDLKEELAALRMETEQVGSIQKMYNSESWFFRLRNFRARTAPVGEWWRKLRLAESHMERIERATKAVRALRPVLE